MEAVALWVNRKPNKEFDLQMTGSQEVLFWYKRTIISLQFFINLIRRKYFRIQASMNTGTELGLSCRGIGMNMMFLANLGLCYFRVSQQESHIRAAGKEKGGNKVPF